MTVVLGLGAFLSGKDLIQQAAGSTNWIVYALELGGNFTVGIVVLLTGVRIMIAELEPAFKGISEKVVPGAVPALDMPVFFPLAPVASVLGFLGAFIGEFLGFAILLLTGSPILMIPGIIATFFDGGVAGVFGFKYGGKKSAVISGIAVGLVQILVGSFSPNYLALQHLVLRMAIRTLAQPWPYSLSL
jgi:PTS system ascorbate-specific IIC component